ncbi:sugar ABC transporter ATP-binding protein [uncultured Nocardioides sp.]|uniref:sugar ABC transporter ATP-binding protein n=1 Tax=uncultured Nocardioides sp. TaxID=198441 RepID=UPI002604A405|nr:sugar ABC transporter ATP-binding protein [uncultured Nocardioides sp.]
MDAVVLKNVSKSFEGVTVLHGVDLSILPGQIHGLVGENGSGKSTLVKILGGIHTPDRGSELFLHGTPVSLPVRNSQRHGMAIIHQDLALVESMSVADNVGIATGFERRPLSPIRLRRERRIVAALSKRFGLTLDPDQLVGELSPGEQSIVAVLRALRQLGTGGSGDLIVLDEPTAALPRGESIKLLELLRTMANNGTAVLYISHRMSEVLSICDQISVLRSGRMVATRNAAESNEAEIVELMLGLALGDFYTEKHVSRNETVRLDVLALGSGGLSNVTFQAHEGEILGITGLAGMGQDEIPYVIAGGRNRSAGEIQVDGTLVDGSVRAAKRAGVQLVPGNRQRDAFWLGGTAKENLTLPFLSRFWSPWGINSSRERDFTMKQMNSYGVRPKSPLLQITKFSGGNQQKIVMARAMSQHPNVLLLHEPTQGVDAGAKKEILEVVRRAAEAGTAVVVFSSDSEEVAQVCHRVHIMRYGSIAATLSGSDVTEDRIISLCQRSLVAESGK